MNNITEINSKGMILIILATLFLSINVLAIAPTITSLSPVNNSIYFNINSITCNANDPQSFPVNYTFYTSNNLDLFNRDNSDTLGNNWIEGLEAGGDSGNALIYNNTLNITVKKVSATTVYFAKKVIPVTTNITRIDWAGYKTAIGASDKQTIEVFDSSNNICLEAGSNSNAWYANGVTGGSISANVYNKFSIRNIDVVNQAYDFYVDDAFVAHHAFGQACSDLKTIYLHSRTDTVGQISTFYDNLTYQNQLSEMNIAQNGSSQIFTYPFYNGTNYQISCRACNSNNECSDFTNSTFSFMSFDRCNYKDSFNNINPAMTLNFTFKNEEDLSTLNASAGFTSNLFSAQDNQNYVFNLASNTTYLFCLNPINTSISLTGLIDYTPYNASFTFARQYYFVNASLKGNTLNNIILYSLQDSLASPVTFTVVQNAILQQNVYIWLQRYYPETNTYALVGEAKTNANGQDIIYARLTDAFYRILAIQNGIVVYDSGVTHIISTNYLIDLSGIPINQTYYGIYNSLNNLQYNLSFNKTGTNYVVLTVADPTGLSTSSCLRINQYNNQNGTTQVFYNCSSGALITQQYQMQDLTKSFTAYFIAFNNNVYRIVANLFVKLGEVLATRLGTDGLFIAFFLICGLAMLGLFNPKVSIILTLFGFITAFLLQLIDISWTSVIVICILGGILIVKIK